MPARGDLETFQYLPIDMQGNGTGFGGGFKGEQFHRIRSEQGTREDAGHWRRLSRGGRNGIIGHGRPLWRKEGLHIARLRVRRNGGSSRPGHSHG